MQIEDITWHREHDIRLRIMDAKIDRIALMLQRHLVTGATPMQTLPPSSPTPTVSPSILQRSLEKIGREAIVSILMWALGKLGLWLFTLVLPAMLSFGALAWMLLRRWLSMG